jgi:hypothetical protein
MIELYAPPPPPVVLVRILSRIGANQRRAQFEATKSASTSLTK